MGGRPAEGHRRFEGRGGARRRAALSEARSEERRRGEQRRAAESRGEQRRAEESRREQRRADESRREQTRAEEVFGEERHLRARDETERDGEAAALAAGEALTERITRLRVLAAHLVRRGGDTCGGHAYAWRCCGGRCVCVYGEVRVGREAESAAHHAGGLEKLGDGFGARRGGELGAGEREGVLEVLARLPRSWKAM